MADKQPPAVVEGATSHDPEEEVNAPKSAEDRKAASALASLDDRTTSAAESATSPAAAAVDQDAINKATKKLHGGSSGGGGSKGSTTTAATRKHVKVDAADVALLVDQLEMTKPKATEFLKSHDGDAVRALRAFVSA